MKGKRVKPTENRKEASNKEATTRKHKEVINERRPLVSHAAPLWDVPPALFSALHADLLQPRRDSPGVVGGWSPQGGAAKGTEGRELTVTLSTAC